MLGTELVAEGLWFSARHLESLGTWDAPGEHQQRCVAYTGDDVEVGKDGVCEECLCAVTPGCAAVLCIPALPKGPRLFWEHIPGAPCALPCLTRWIERPNGSASVPRVCRSAGVLLQPSRVPVLVREPSRWSSVPVLRDARGWMWLRAGGAGPHPEQRHQSQWAWADRPLRIYKIQNKSFSIKKKYMLNYLFLWGSAL